MFFGNEGFGFYSDFSPAIRFKALARSSPSGFFAAIGFI